MKHILTILLFILCCLHLPAQQLELPHVKLTNEQQVDNYFEHVGLYSPLYSGKEQIKYATHIKNDPYLKNPGYDEGSLLFDGVFYPKVYMRLDLYRNELLVRTPDNRFNIIVPNEKVSYLTLHSYYIFYHYPDEKPGSPPEGYYLRLYEGKHTVLERKNRGYLESIRDMKLEGEFVNRDRYYIYKDGKYYPVKSKSAVLKFFDSHKRELKQFIKQNRLNFRTDPDQAIVAVVKHYEKLTH
ncbi:MAG: hypothetical protein LUG51_09900 [Tannerellaceae bacterium]|nr:hypothetical protein [Tannerellaceae bacterium]